MVKSSKASKKNTFILRLQQVEVLLQVYGNASSWLISSLRNNYAKSNQKRKDIF